jgi:toxin ParE1/3/4
MPFERRIRLTPLAEADLEDIWLYTVKTWSVEQAESYHAGIIAAFVGLANGTKVGQSLDVRAGYLKYAVGSHLVFFRLSDPTVDVIRILHQRMDVSLHLQD